jgi:hypothetical protein
MGIALAASRGSLGFSGLQEVAAMPPVPALRSPYDSPAPSEPGGPLRRAAQWLRAVKRFDDQRAGIPGEHWFAFGTGAALLLRGRRSPSPVLRTAATLGGLLFMARGLSGRDGLVGKLQRRQRAAGAG